MVSYSRPHKKYPIEEIDKLHKENATLRADNAWLREAVEAANKFATHFLDNPEKITWSDLQNLLVETQDALAANEESDA
jgi:hypothetical protein